MKFSIVTPAYNIERYIAETIESVLSQEGDFEIEYIVVVDKSADRTALIAKEYAERLRSGVYKPSCRAVYMYVIEPEQSGGMYAALTQGFSKATGDIYAWIAADDTYEAGAFVAMARAFEAYPHIEWLKGITSTIDERGNTIERGIAKLYYQKWIEAGIYGMEAYHVEQDSVFWRASLWKKIGAFPINFRSMGDYWLWMQFSKHARLWTINTPISFFRRRPDQDSKINAERCRRQMWEARGNRRPLLAWSARLFFYPYYNVPHWPRAFWSSLYFFFFPLHPREYLGFENGHPLLSKARTFSL